MNLKKLKCKIGLHRWSYFEEGPLNHYRICPNCYQLEKQFQVPDDFEWRVVDAPDVRIVNAYRNKYPHDVHVVEDMRYTKNNMAAALMESFTVDKRNEVSFSHVGLNQIISNIGDNLDRETKDKLILELEDHIESLGYHVSKEESGSIRITVPKETS